MVENEELLNRFKKAAARRQDLLDTVGRCVHSERLVTGCCERRYRCHHPEQEGRIFEPVECSSACALFQAPAPLSAPTEATVPTISAVIIAHNEGDEVRRTVESLQASVQEAKLEVILVDDGSTDGSCEFARGREGVHLIRHDMPVGVGRSRNAGWREATGDVVTFHDAHMRFPMGAIETLAAKAHSSGAVTAAGSTGMGGEGGFSGWGCDLFYNARDGLQGKWCLGKPTQEWQRVPCMMGACYVIGRQTAQELEAATGHLWDDVAGRWGFSEQGLALKAFLLDIPILVNPSVVAEHLYRNANPLPDASREVWRNVTQVTAALFGREHYERRFLPYTSAQLPEEHARISADAFVSGPLPWKVPVETVFTHLCGRDAHPEQTHPEHAWLPEVEEACRKLAQERPAGRGVRVLQWRPGEATFVVRSMLPEANVVAIEWSGHRLENWRPLCAAQSVQLHAIGLGPDYWETPAKAGWGVFDLVLVGGEKQEECKGVAEQVLAPGGLVLTDPSCGAGQIDTTEREKEEKHLKAMEGAPHPGPKVVVRTVAKPSGAVPPDVRASVLSKPPLVSCMCSTYGRFSKLSEALTCFLMQDYPNRELLILNNNSVPLECHLPKVRLFNEPKYPTLGDCRNRLIELAEGEFVRTWDDDDLYLPWTLRQGVENIGEAPAWKPARSWFSAQNRKYDLADNVFEAATLVRADVAKKYGYKAAGGDEHQPLLLGIEEEGGCAKREMGWLASYIYRWADGLFHISGSLGSGDIDSRTRDWQSHNVETGEGQELTPVDMSGYWRSLISDARRTLGDDADRLEAALSAYGALDI